MLRLGLGLLLLGQVLPPVRAVIDSTDPSCATIEVASAATFEGDTECPAVLVSITLSATTEDCASDGELSMATEEDPRDVKTYGAMESSTEVEGNKLTWIIPLLTVGSPLALEFALDLCGYCEKYPDRKKFNPIDSFHYTDNEGNEPNQLPSGYKLKLPCDGIEGERVVSIVDTLPPTPSPVVFLTEKPTRAPATTSSIPTMSPTIATRAPATTSSIPTMPPTIATRAPVTTSSIPTMPPTIATRAPAPTASMPTMSPTIAPVIAEVEPTPTGQPTLPPATLSPTRAGEDVERSYADTESPSPSESDNGLSSGYEDRSIDGTEMPTGSPSPPAVGVFFTEEPTSASSPSPTFAVDLATQGMTLKIQSVFEARRRVLRDDANISDADARRALAIVYAEDADEFDLAMITVCAAVLGVDEADVMSVSTDFGPDGPAEDAARREMQSSSSASSTASASATIDTIDTSASSSATQLMPITTCEVSASGGSESRSMTAAGFVDRLLVPKNFVLMLDENRFGPVNAAVSSISFWQNACSDGTCPAGDGSYASVFPMTETEDQGIVGEEEEEEEDSLFWFAVIVALLTVMASAAWCIFCACCGRSLKRHYASKAKETPEEDPYVVAVGRAERAPESPKPKPEANGKRFRPPPVSTTRAKNGGVREPPSPGEADWRRMFGLNPSRESSHRSAPISPRPTGSSSASSGGSYGERLQASDGPFFATSNSSKYRDQVIAASDASSPSRPRPSTGGTTKAQGAWEEADDLNANVQHINDPVVRGSIAKAGRMIANALTPPRKEINRLRKSLDKPAKVVMNQSFGPMCSSSSPTVTVSSQGGPGSTRGSVRDGITSDSETASPSVIFRTASFSSRSTPKPIYEIELNPDGSGRVAVGGPENDAGAKKEEEKITAISAVSGHGGGDDGSSVVSGMNAPFTPSSPERGRTSGRNMFAKPPGSGSKGSRSPRRRSKASASTCGSDVSSSEVSVPYGSDGTRPSTLAEAAASAAASVGLPASARRSHARPYVTSCVTSPIHPDGKNVRSVSVASEPGAGSDEPPSMPPLPPNVNQVAKREVAVADEAATRSTEKPVNPWAGVLAGFACLTVTDQGSPCEDSAAGSGGSWQLNAFGSQQSPGSSFSRLSSTPSSRLPEIGDDDDDDVVEVGVARREKRGSYSHRRPPYPDTGGGDSGTAAVTLPLEKSPGKTRSRPVTPILTPVVEGLAEEDSFSDSETESEFSSRASSASGVSGARRAPRDPAALLAAAIERAGQVAAIPPPSSGSPGLVKRHLSVVQEVPAEAVILTSPLQSMSSIHKNRREERDSYGEAPSSPTESTSPIPPPAQRPESGEARDRGYPVSSGAFFGEKKSTTAKTRRVKGSPVKGVSPASADGATVSPRATGAVAVKASDSVIDMDIEEGEKVAEGANSCHNRVDDDTPRLVTPPTGSPPRPRAMSVREQTPSPPSPPETALQAEAKHAGFSLMSALSTFLGRKENARSPGNVPDENVPEKVPTVTDGPDDDVPANITVSSSSHTLKVWPDAPAGSSKLSLDSVVGDESTSEPLPVTPRHGLPALSLSSGRNAGPGDSPFSREKMNLQSPEPAPTHAPTFVDGATVVRKATMPDLPKPPSVTSMASMKTPVAAGTKSHISDASPMYDRVAIARAMSQAASAAASEVDGESDIGVPIGKAWPSARKSPYANDTSGVISDVTSSSGSDASGNNRAANYFNYPPSR